MLTLCKKFHKFFWYVTRSLNFKLHALTYEGWESSIFPKNPFALFPRRAVIDAVRFLSRWMWEKLVQDFPWISMSSLNLLHHIFAKTSVYWINWTQSLPDLRLRFRHVCARNSSLFPPNQYFFEGSFALCTIFLWTVQPIFQKGIFRIAKITKTTKISDQKENDLYWSWLSLRDCVCYKETVISALYGETVLQV